jgi:hypothetical protein
MEWQKEMDNGMEVDWFFKYSITLLLLVITNQIFSQSDEEYSKEKGLSISTQSLFLFPYSDGVGGGIQDTPYDLEFDSRVYGVNTSINYYINPYMAGGFGIGYEKLTQPEIVYYPLFLNLRSTLMDTKSTITTGANFGVHLGDVDQAGFMFRWVIGYRSKLFKNILSYFEMIYSYQNIYKSFNNSGRVDNYYNVESIGLSISVEFQ